MSARARKIAWLVTAATAVITLLNINLMWHDGDEDRYVILAQSMARGLGQTDMSHPEPQPEVVTPPAYPLTLAALLRIFGDTELVPLMVFSAVCYIVFAFILFRMLLAVPGFSPLVSLGVCLIALFGVLPLSYTWRIFSETSYLMVSFLALWCCYRAADRRTLAQAGLAGLVVGLAALLRPVGIALFPAGLLHFCWRRSWKQAAVFCLLLAITYGPFMLRAYRLAGVPIPHMVYMRDPSGAPFALMPETIAQLLPYFLFQAVPRRLFFSLFDYRCLLCQLHLAWLIVPGMALVSATVLIGFFSRLRRPGMLEFYWVFNLLMVSTQRVSLIRGVEDRYLIPILPVAAIYLVMGFGVIANWLGRTPRVRKALAVIPICLCAAYVTATGLGAGAVRFRNELNVWGLHPWDSRRYESIGTPDDVAFARYKEACVWIKDHLPAETVIVARKPGHAYLFSGRAAAHYGSAELPGASLWERISGRLYTRPLVVVQDAFPAESGYGRDRMLMLDPVIKEHASELELLWSSSPPVTRVWRAKGSPSIVP